MTDPLDPYRCCLLPRLIHRHPAADGVLSPRKRVEPLSINAWNPKWMIHNIFRRPSRPWKSLWQSIELGPCWCYCCCCCVYREMRGWRDLTVEVDDAKSRWNHSSIIVESSKSGRNKTRKDCVLHWKRRVGTKELKKNKSLSSSSSSSSSMAHLHIDDDALCAAAIESHATL